MAGDHTLNFGLYRLDPANARLWRETQPVRLTPKAFQVLCYLAGRPGQLVTKEELFQAVWADTVISDATMTSAIQEIRKALQDTPKNPQYVETVHKRGFRFIAPLAPALPGGSRQEQGLESNGQRLASSVQELGAEPISVPQSFIPAPHPLSPNAWDSPYSPQDFSVPAPVPPIRLRPWLMKSLVLSGMVLLVGVLVAVYYLSLSAPTPQPLPLPDKPSIIVLPFVNLSNDPQQDYFSDGLTEVLTGDLSRISSLFVIARNSAFTYKGKAVKVQDVGREMGVRYVLEGSVQRADQRVRITTRLIDATTGYHVWSEQYDRPLADLFALQDEIVQKVVTTLRLQLTMQERGHIVHKHTDNLEAYDAFLRGVEFYYRYTQEANAQARQLFERAVALDPQYAEAYASLGWTYWLAWSLRWSVDPQTLERALALAHQAVALDDSLPEAHTSLGLVYAMKQQYDYAIAEGERAIALDPNNADSYANQAQVLNWAGRPEDALRTVEQAIRLSPRSPFWYLWELGCAYRWMGRYTEAIVALKEASSRNPKFMSGHLDLAITYWLQWRSQQSPVGQTLELAVAAVERSLALNDSFPWNHIILGYVYLYQQQYDQALGEIKRGVALASTEAGTYAALAAVLSNMGRTEEALEAAAQALRLKASIPDSHLGEVGIAYAVAERYEEARAPLQRFLSRFSNMLSAHLMLAAVYSELGQEVEARAEAAEVLRLNPQFSLEVHKQRMPIKDPAVLERHIAALRKAGLK